MSDIERLSGLRVGFAVCGSFCTFEKAFKALEELTELGCEITPIMSFNAYSLDTRFGTAQKNAARMFEITGKTVLHDITSTEPVGPKKMFDVLVVAPCTGNTLAKLAVGITDTSEISKITPKISNAVCSIKGKENNVFTKPSRLFYVTFSVPKSPRFYLWEGCDLFYT